MSQIQIRKWLNSPGKSKREFTKSEINEFETEVVASATQAMLKMFLDICAVDYGFTDDMLEELAATINRWQDAMHDKLINEALLTKLIEDEVGLKFVKGEKKC